MTGSIPDPRLEAALRAVGAHFQHDPEWYREGVAIALIAADAHDEASGVRRVTAQELARAQADALDAAAADLLAGRTMDVCGWDLPDYHQLGSARHQVVEWLHARARVLFAVSPVGGES